MIRYHWLNMDTTWWADTIDVQHLFDTARAFDARGEDVKASFYYRKIANYCSLGFLPEDDKEGWLAPYRHHYEYLYLQTLTQLIQIYQSRDELEEMQEYAYQTLLLDPCCESAMIAIIDSYFKQGNIPMAISKLDTFNRVLHDELGLKPGKELHALRKNLRHLGNMVVLQEIEEEPGETRSFPHLFQLSKHSKQADEERHLTLEVPS